MRTASRELADLAEGAIPGETGTTTAAEARNVMTDVLRIFMDRSFHCVSAQAHKEHRFLVIFYRYNENARV
jgi:hypothetical protein